MKAVLPFRLEHDVSKDQKSVTRRWTFSIDGEYEESVVLVFSFADSATNIYENEDLISVGKGTTVEWKSENQTTVFKIEKADSDRVRFSINGVEFSRLSSAPREPEAPAAQVAESPQTRKERLSREALISAVSQWREVRSPSSNAASQQGGALEEALKVQAELQQLATKLARDRDEALRRLKEWEARGGPEGSEEGEGYESEDDHEGEEEEEGEQYDETDIVEEEFVTETLGEVWEKQQLGLLPRDPAHLDPSEPAQPLAGASPPTDLRHWDFDLDLCNLEKTVVRNEFDSHYVRAFEDVFFRLTNDVTSLREFAGTALLAPLNVALSALNVHAQLSAPGNSSLPQFSWHSVWDDFDHGGAVDEGAALGVGEFKLDWTFQVSNLLEAYLEYNAFSRRNTAESTNAYAAVVQMNHNMRMNGVKYGILTTLKQTWVFRRVGESDLLVSDKFGQADIVKLFLSTLVTSVVERATARDEDEESLQSESVRGDARQARGTSGVPAVHLEDSQIIAESVDYEGAAISVIEARQMLGLAEYSAKVVSHYILQGLADESGEISLSLYLRGMNKLIGDKYAVASVLTRSKIDFVLARLFEVFDIEGTGFANAVELACGLLLFCGDDALVRSRVAWELLEGDAARDKPLDYEAVVRAVSGLIKAQLCLDPSLQVDTFLSAVEVRANLKAIAFFPQQKLGRVVSQAASHFVELFSCTLFMCQSEAMDLELEKYQSHPNGTVSAASEPTVESKSRSPRSASSQSQELRPEASSTNDGDDDSQPWVTDVKDDPALGDEDSEDSDHNSSRPGMLSLRSFSLDNVESESEDENIFLSDDHFPPSAVVLELRAARAILGLENYCADEMMAILAEYSPGGQLSESGWIRWLSYMSHVAKTPVQDLDIAINLGNLLFAAFDDDESSSSAGSPVKGAPRENQIAYERMAAGLAFLCGGSPLEERLMVAFTVMDADSDGCITPVELLEIIKCALLVISVCSRMVSDKVLLLGAPLAELAEAAAIEAISALNVDNTAAYITLEMLCETSDDFLKLAALF